MTKAHELDFRIDPGGGFDLATCRRKCRFFRQTRTPLESAAVSRVTISVRDDRWRRDDAMMSGHSAVPVVIDRGKSTTSPSCGG